VVVAAEAGDLGEEGEEVGVAEEAAVVVGTCPAGMAREV
jgi:hypothetical protein